MLPLHYDHHAVRPGGVAPPSPGYRPGALLLSYRQFVTVPLAGLGADGRIRTGNHGLGKDNHPSPARANAEQGMTDGVVVLYR